MADLSTELLASLIVDQCLAIRRELEAMRRDIEECLMRLKPLPEPISFTDARKRADAARREAKAAMEKKFNYGGNDGLA